MADPLAGPFAQILAANRARFNARFAEARRFQPRLDPAAFGEHLRSVVAPLVEAVGREQPAQAAEVADVLYDLSLDLLGREFLGPNSRYPLIAEGWRFLLPRLSHFIAESPREFIGSLTNALYNLSTTPGARPHEWAAALLRLAEISPDAPTLLKAGQVAAWRAGLAHYRLSALDLCRVLPPPSAFTALGLPSQTDHAPLDQLIESLTANPWLRPDSNLQSPMANLQIVTRVGAFRGFGGLFIVPPLVFGGGDHFLVTDGEGTWLLAADRFGATFHRSDGQAALLKGQPASQFQVDPTGRVQKSSHSQVFHELAGFASAADIGTTLAVTTPLSHAVYLVALAD